MFRGAFAVTLLLARVGTMTVMQRFGLHSYVCCMPVWLMFMCTLGALSRRLGTQAFSLLLLLNGSQYQVSWQSWVLPVCLSIHSSESMWALRIFVICWTWGVKQKTHHFAINPCQTSTPCAHQLYSPAHLTQIRLLTWNNGSISGYGENISGQNVNAVSKGCCI